MKTYRATISADKYPLDFTVQATCWSTAAARAIRLWKARFKGSRTEQLSIRIVRVSSESI